MHKVIKREIRATGRNLFRCVEFACLLCLALSVPAIARTGETLGPFAPPNPYVMLPSTFPDYSALIVRAAAEHEQDELPRHSARDNHPAGAPDWRGIKRDTGYFVAYQFVAIGILYAAPESISSWSDEQKDDRDFDKWKDNAGDPQWDKDDWWINYILHPYWGGAYYIRAQERGLNSGQSFWYSALLSTLYEFGAEAIFEAPSYQDIIVTPVAGSLLGHYLFMPLRERIRAQRGEPDWAGKTLLFLTDPLGVISVQTDKFLGVGTDVSLQLVPMVSNSPLMIPGQVADLQSQDPTESSTVQGWGLQMRLVW